MSGRTPTPKPQTLAAQVSEDFRHLDAGCKQTLGVSAPMYRTAKWLFYLSTLLFSVYLIELAGVTPIVAMGFAALLITGPEGLEMWLVRQGAIADPSDDAEG